SAAHMDQPTCVRGFYEDYFLNAKGKDGASAAPAVFVAGAGVVAFGAGVAGTTFSASPGTSWVLRISGNPSRPLPITTTLALLDFASSSVASIPFHLRSSGEIVDATW